MSDEIATALQIDYGWSEPVTITLLQDGQAGNKTYLADSDGRKTILKVYGDYWMNKIDWIENEIELLLYLSSAGVLVGTPVARIDGGYLGAVKTPEGARHYAGFTVAEGTMEWPLGEAKSRNLGVALANLHLAASAFRAQRPWREYDVDRLVDAPLRRMLPYVVGRRCEAFLAGYRSVRDISPEEASAIPAFVKIRDLWETGDWIECGQNLDPKAVTDGVECLVRRFEAKPLTSL